MNGLQFDVNYDASALTPADNALTTDRTDGYTVDRRDISTSTVRYFCYSLDNKMIAKGNGLVFRLPFSLKPGSTLGSYQFAVENVVLGSENLDNSNSEQGTQSFDVNLSVEDAMAEPECYESVYNLQGVCVYRGQRADRPQLPTGIYLVRTPSHVARVYLK